MKASSFYRARIWRFGLWMSRHLPPSASAAAGTILADVYWRLQRVRREVVIQNLLPVLDNNRAAASRLSRQLFHEFARKLFDLWRYEGGQLIAPLTHDPSDWPRFEQARAPGRGVLLLTPHLGNWEFGGALLRERGLSLQVITAAEPDRALTEARQAARARWGIETLVIREDPFAFVEVIRRLDAGATVALLVDRPPRPTAVTVSLFGRDFAASVAAAELARASGCALLPVYLVRRNSQYHATILPQIEYDRKALGHRAARLALTQEIMHRFEPAIQEFATQWYHFVPIWPQHPE